jgi:hypothetical protein
MGIGLVLAPLALMLARGSATAHAALVLSPPRGPQCPERQPLGMSRIRPSEKR